jgi:polysaccharide biosynthesis/export protein
MQRFFERLSLVVAAGLILLGAARTSLVAQQREEPQGAVPRSEPLQEQRPLQHASPQAPQEGQNDYVLGPEDVLRIDVFQVPELSNLEVRVANDGTITVPLLGCVEAAGLTATQLADKLQSEWGQSYLQNPQVTVFVKQFQAKPVSVVGAVERPGLFYLTGPRTLVEVLSIEGDLAKRTSSPAGPTVYVTRHGGFRGLHPVPGMRLISPDKVEIDIRRLPYSNETALNIPIEPFDNVRVIKADIVYATGRSVQRPS